MCSHTHFACLEKARATKKTQEVHVEGTECFHSYKKEGYVALGVRVQWNL